VTDHPIVPLLYRNHIWSHDFIKTSSPASA